jgi:hypothetical protein
MEEWKLFKNVLVKVGEKVCRRISQERYKEMPWWNTYRKSKEEKRGMEKFLKI